MTTTTTRPLAGIDRQTLSAERRDLSAKLEELRRVPLKFRSDGHDAVEEIREQAAERLDGLLDGTIRDLLAGGRQVPPGIGDLIALIEHPAVVERWHALISAGPTGSGTRYPAGESRAEWSTRRASLTEGLDAIDAELRYRDEEERRTTFDREQQGVT